MSKSAVEFRPATLADADYLAPRLSPVERAEVIAASGPDVLATVRRSIAISLEAHAAIYRGKLAGVFGHAVPALLGRTAVPWVLGTPMMPRVLAIHNQTVVDYLDTVREIYPHLVNYVDARNVASVAWLASLGFEIGEAAPFGVARLPFHRFEVGHV